MAKIIRCPACGALWKVSDDFADSRLQCSECHTVFSADKAETVQVSDERLEARLASVRPSVAPAEESAETTMNEIASQLSEFESRNPVYIPPRQSSWQWLFSLLAFVILLIILAEGALLGHKYVLEQFPVLEPLYEKVCRKVPCPGFAWTDPGAVRTTATLAPDSANPRKVAVSIGLTNTTEFAQKLPLLEVRFLDAAGDTIAQRLLERGTYGLAAGTILAPQQKAMVTLTPDATFPVAPVSVKVRSVTDMR